MRIPERKKSLILQLLNVSEPSGTSSLFDARAQIFKYGCLLGEIQSSEIPDAQGSRNSFHFFPDSSCTQAHYLQFQRIISTSN